LPQVGGSPVPVFVIPKPIAPSVYSSKLAVGLLSVPIAAVAPTQILKLDPESVEPGRFLNRKPVTPLLDITRRAAIESERPPFPGDGARKIKRGPCRRIRRMLQNAAESSHRVQRSLKTPSIVAALQPKPRFREAGESRPPGAGRVRDHRPRAGVLPRVPFFVPRVNVRQAVVDAVRLHVQRGDQISPQARAVLGQGYQPRSRQPLYAISSCVDGFHRWGNPWCASTHPPYVRAKL
jgi:hypothetical protein